jgi:uncharacterized protein YdeI (YjbR/CyaY-like superfamily)
MNPKVDFYFTKGDKWQDEFIKLREIILTCPLIEELKWGHPCYTFNKKNVVLMHGFKEYCALLFMKGALMADPNNILIQQTENVQAGRHIRFTNLQQIIDLETVLKNYILQAIELEKSGAKVELKKISDYKIPDELQHKFDQHPELKAAFDSLTPGRQHGYIFHISQPKQSATRFARIEKCWDRIMSGKGFNED